MTDFGDFIAHGVITQAIVCEGDETLEDLGIMSIEPGQVVKDYHKNFDKGELRGDA